MALSYLYPPEIQYQSRAGVNNTAGFLRVFYTQTDDRAPTYSDFGGTLNEADIVLDSDGRAVVIVDDTKTYRLEVYNRNGGLLFTCDPITAQGGGGGSGSVTRIVSTDGTVGITTSSGGGLVTYDLSTALTERPSEWGGAVALKAAIDGDGTWEQVPVVSTSGTSVYSNGWTAAKDTAYDLAASIEMPNGSPDAIRMIDARFDVEVDGVLVKSEYGSIDPSRGMDRVAFEWKGGASEGQVVNGRLFVRCGEPLTLGIVGNILYNEECDGIIGEGGGGGGGYVAGQYIDIAADVISVTGVQPAGNYVYRNEISSQSAMWDTVSGKEDKVNWGLSGNTLTSINGHDLAGASYSAGQYVDIAGNVISVTGLQPSGDYAYNSAVSSKVDQSAFDDCCSSMSGAVSSLQVDVSAISAVVSGISGDYIQYAALETASGMITGISGTALAGGGAGHEYSGIWPVVVDNDQDIISAANKPLCVDETMTGYESAGSAVIGVNTGTVLSGLTAYQLTADMSGYQPSGDYAYNSSLNDYQPVSGMTAYQLSGDYAYNSAVSGKQDASAMTAYQLSGDYAYNSSLADYQPTSAMTAYQLSGDYYSASNPSGFITGVDLSNYATTGYVDSSVSGKLDTTAFNSGDFYSTSNPSGFITGVDLSDYATTGYVDSSVSGKADSSALTAYQLTADMTGYQPSGDYYSASNPSGFITGVDLSDYATTGYVDSSVSGKLDASASGDFYSTSNPSGFITGVDLSDYATTGYVDSSVSGKQDASAMTAYQSAGDYQPSGDYLSATESSNYLLTSQSGMFQPSGNYQPSGDYAFNSSLADYQPVSAMTAYQPAGDYQPSGDYIYVSALGWAEV